MFGLLAQDLDPAFARSLLVFLLGYVTILATPGPNLLVIGSVAALRGVRGVVPLCLGVSLGAATLSAVLLAAVRVAPAGSWFVLVRAGGALLLLWVALKIAWKRPVADAEPPPGAGLAELGAGFCTAATNPLTAAFFTAQFLGPLSSGGSLRAVIPISVMTVAMLFFLAVSSLLARPLLRRNTIRWHRPICLSAATVLVLMAASTLRELML